MNNVCDNIVSALAWLATIYGLGLFVYYVLIAIKYVFILSLNLL